MDNLKNEQQYVDKCIDCESNNVRIIDTRKRSDGTVKRRKKCVNCGFRWTTVEIEYAIYKKEV